MSFELGIVASLSAPLVMTIGFMVWESHWKGSAFSLNLFKCNLASLGFLVIVLATNSAAELEKLFTDTKVSGYLFLSSAIGIVIGDWTWLQALQTIGARQVILMDSIKPFLAALLGWLILEEDLKVVALAGIFLTVAGVLVVSLETTKEEDSDVRNVDKDEGIQEGEKEQQGCASSGNLETGVELPKDPEVADETGGPIGAKGSASKWRTQSGYLMSLLNIALDTYGAILIKQVGGDLTVWEISLLRFGFAGLVMFL